MAHVLVWRLAGSLFAGLLALALAGVARAQDEGQNPNRPPNMVVILADDLGYGDLGCFGHPKFKTPHLDKLAEQGARLTHAYAPAPYCAPSRAALLTGRYPWRCRMTRNPAPDSGVNDVGLPAEHTTLAEALRTAGYATACIGKWHLGHRPEFFPTRHGFDEYLGILYSNDMRPVNLVEGEQVVEYPVVQATLTRRYTERAVKFIAENRQRPFLLYLPHAMPHKPLAASEAFYKKSGAGLYGDVIAELDWSVGQILETLDRLKLRDHTLVFFASDNGAWFGGSTGGLRGMKGQTWEGGLRIPLIVRWPGKIPPRQVLDAPCGLIDVLPTVLRAAGIPIPNELHLDGKDLLPVLTQQAASPHEALFAMQGNQLMCVRSGPWKLHLRVPGRPRYLDEGDNWIDPRAPDGVTLLAPYEQYKPTAFPGVATGDQGPPPLLFNLVSDPAEQHNVAEQHPEVVARLTKLYDEVSRDFRP
jgi:uncharacterized sulfatase